MKIEIDSRPVEKVKGDALILGFFEDQKKFDPRVNHLDLLSGGVITNLMVKGDFKAKLNEIAVIYPSSQITFQRLVLVGLGIRTRSDLDKLRQASATVCKKARELKLKNILTALHWIAVPKTKDENRAQAVAEGFILGGYQMTEYKTLDKDKYAGIESMVLLERERKKRNPLEKGIKYGQEFGWATNAVRDMVNHPANVMTPSKMASIATDLSKQYGFRCRVLSLPEIEKLQMNALLGVGKGSSQEPKFLIMEHLAKKTPRVVLVGKGITFDSGGYSLKSVENMGNMKTDMSGAASVIAIMAVASKLKLPLNLIGLVPLAENLISGTAQKAGDIVKSYSGKTIEIVNTDAEGRLILADALSYAGTYHPDAIVDIATLTGAAKITLGQICIPILGNDDSLKTRMRKASQKSGEKVWELPLWDEYKEQLESDLADLKNSGGKPAGTITGGLFLRQFVGNFPWIHIDIAAVDFEEKGKPYIPKGGTGYGTRLILEFLKDLSGR